MLWAVPGLRCWCSCWNVRSGGALSSGANGGPKRGTPGDLLELKLSKVHPVPHPHRERRQTVLHLHRNGREGAMFRGLGRTPAGQCRCEGQELARSVRPAGPSMGASGQKPGWMCPGLGSILPPEGPGGASWTGSGGDGADRRPHRESHVQGQGLAAS